MSVTTFERNASIAEMAVEMDRRGAVIEALEAELDAERRARVEAERERDVARAKLRSGPFKWPVAPAVDGLRAERDTLAERVKALEAGLRGFFEGVKGEISRSQRSSREAQHKRGANNVNRSYSKAFADGLSEAQAIVHSHFRRAAQHLESSNAE